MRRQLLTVLLVCATAGVLMIGCNGSNTSTQSTQTTPTGTMAIFGGDSPVCDVVSVDLTISGLTLTPQAAQGSTTTPSPVTVTPPSGPVDFAALMDFFTVLNLASVQAGTYNQMTLTLASPVVMVFDPTTKMATSVPATLSTSTVTVNIDPPLTLASNGAAALNIDFKLRKSLPSDIGSSVTINPVFEVMPQPPLNNSLGDDGDVKGTVASTSTTSTNSSFTGSFTVTTENNAPVVNVTSQTTFDGVSGLSGLMAGQFVEVDAFVDPNGNIVAKEVEVQEQEEAQKTAFVGIITSATRDSTTGNVTQFNLFVRNEFPDASSCVQPKSNLTVNVDPANTMFRTRANGENMGDLTFNATSLGPAQRVMVFGQCQTGTPPSVNAAGIFLRKQTVLGNFSSLLSGSNGPAGFVMIPCGAIFNGQPIDVFAFGETGLSGFANLQALTSTPLLAVRGLLLYETQTAMVNSVSVTATPAAPQAIIEARRIHQLQ